jgi:hypothetical protein
MLVLSGSRGWDDACRGFTLVEGPYLINPNMIFDTSGWLAHHGALTLPSSLCALIEKHLFNFVLKIKW